MTALATLPRPMAFYHQDGHIPAWNFAKRYAGPNGHIATLPDIIQARLVTEPGDLPWEAYFTTNTAEYYGTGADGRPKLIVAHGVGPMSTIEGIKRVYSWEYKDKERHNKGGRISAEEFLKLETGHYGEAIKISSARQFIAPSRDEDWRVFVIDFIDYVATYGEVAFGVQHFATTAIFDILLLARLGMNAHAYIINHRKQAIKWHKEESVPAHHEQGPRIIINEDAPNCPYTTYMQVNRKYNWSKPLPYPLEDGKAMGHLISIGGLMHMHSSDKQGHWQGLVSEVSCHEWSNGVRFVGVPETIDWSNGMDQAPSPHDVLRKDWQRFMRHFDNESHTTPRLYRIEHTGNEWFTRYPKSSDGERMDESDVEFHVRSVRAVGGLQRFKVDEMFFLRYSLSQVVALAPTDANAYAIVDVSTKDKAGHTTVAVQFYDADVDTTQRLPRVKEVKQDYDLLMG
jgi:hypothetical protein